MQRNLNEALLYETLCALYKGKEDISWENWSRIAIKADVTRSLPEIISPICEVTGMNSFTVSEEYYKIRNSFATFRTEYSIIREGEAEFPASVKNFHFLYAAGDLSLLSRKHVAVNGLRTPSVNGKENAIRTLEEAKEGGAVPVSTLDTGLDAYALLYAYNERIPSIAVLSSSLRECVPETQKELMVNLANNGSLLLTSFPPSRRAERWFNIPRNRLLVSLSDYFAVCEEKDGGPAWKLAELASEAGKGVILFENQLEEAGYTYPALFSGEHKCHIWHRKGDIRRLFSTTTVHRRNKDASAEQLTLF